MIKKSKFIKTIALVLVLVLSIGILSACGSNSSDTIKVGSKEFTEQLLLGKITVLALKDAGFKVDDKTGVAGSDKVRLALENGDFDLYWEYTGTAWLSQLQNEEPITDSQEAYEKVRDADEENGFIWLQYATLNNTYTLMMRREHSEDLGIKSISDLAEYINENPGELLSAIDHEFSVRPDGYPGVQAHYGFNQSDDEIKIMDLGIMYKTLRENQVDVAMGFATDGRIAAFDLVNLEDDKYFFPVYNAAPVVRKDALEQHPEIKEILEKISPLLDSETMTKLNYEVDINEREPDEVAEEWLKSVGLID
ncbi:glycine betaine ABC transporter substrate-binding protein [Sedimentibacter sp.]|uniref:glycine betaine ABC transporter substrate-binding protein n=1 Tax=Sedimentibacter sp. TaxID=1960295 RepID=UPI000ED43CB6|nr:glycine betaine ABC transporter substrate-binding protein [Sedimentibacter sp.]HCX63078.1 glycine/betaine ABC transporter substrate-binding protein [Clostridiales bacterium]